MRDSIASYFDAHDTTIRREALAGVTTFVTMAYIIAANLRFCTPPGFRFFFAPLVTAIPLAANGTALVIIGSMMMAPTANIDFDDPTESIPALRGSRVDQLHFQHRRGITAGLVLHPIFKLEVGRSA